MAHVLARSSRKAIILDLVFDVIWFNP